MKDVPSQAAPALAGKPAPDSSGARCVPDDEAVVRGLRAGDPAAAQRLFDQYARHVRVVLMRVLGAGDIEQADLLQEVFIRALERVHQLKDPRALKAWLTSIAVFTARETIRSRTRRRWLVFGTATPEPVGPPQPEESGEAVRHLYALLARFPADERIAFTLRFIEGMELMELAEACQVSLSTIRRRLARAEDLFRRLARDYPALQERLEGNA